MRVQCARSVRVVQLFGRLAVVETHILWSFGHHCCLVPYPPLAIPPPPRTRETVTSMFF